MGVEAAELFYDSSRFSRHRAAPGFLKKTLFGEEGVQGLEGSAHNDRKLLFMQCLDRDELPSLLEVTSTFWKEREALWREKEDIVLLDELALMLCGAMMTWCGIPIDDLEQHTDDFRQLIEGADPAGSQHFKGRWARRRTDEWLTEVVRRERARPHGDTQSPLSRFCRYRDRHGQLLPAETVAVELNNLVRPTVAIAWYALAAIHASLQHPDAVAAPGDLEAETHFVNEVRRLHPFFPMVCAVVKKPFEWKGVRFSPGKRVFLDIYGTNRDPRCWREPERFLPARFEAREIGAYEFIPQGGGDHLMGHRCAGEWVTIELMKLVLRQMQGLEFELPNQSLSMDLTKMPARVESGLILRGVGRKNSLENQVADSFRAASL